MVQQNHNLAAWSPITEVNVGFWPSTAGELFQIEFEEQLSRRILYVRTQLNFNN